MTESAVRKLVRQELLETMQGQNIDFRSVYIYDFYEDDPVVGQKAEEWLGGEEAFMVSTDMIPYSVVEYLNKNSERRRTFRETGMSSEYGVEVNVMGQEFPAIEYKSGGVSFFIFPPEARRNVRQLISQ